MRPDQWQTFKKAAKRASDAVTPVALIVDSPWIPGYIGVSHMDYYLDPEVWFQANFRIIREFEDIILFPLLVGGIRHGHRTFGLWKPHPLLGRPHARSVALPHPPGRCAILCPGSTQPPTA